MISTTTIKEIIVAFLEPSRKGLAQISASIKTTHVLFPEGAGYMFVVAIMLAYEYRKRVTTLNDTQEFSAPENPPKYNP